MDSRTRPTFAGMVVSAWPEEQDQLLLGWLYLHGQKNKTNSCRDGCICMARRTRPTFAGMVVSAWPEEQDQFLLGWLYLHGQKNKTNFCWDGCICMARRTRPTFAIEPENKSTGVAVVKY
ncbi:hypothetical protein BgiBS90_004136 [Biomphalaria glabrata]|nr:hypothetical protein BgiBS90_004136 [Biomphalaria glabrata]